MAHGNDGGDATLVARRSRHNHHGGGDYDAGRCAQRGGIGESAGCHVIVCSRDSSGCGASGQSGQSAGLSSLDADCSRPGDHSRPIVALVLAGSVVEHMPPLDEEAGRMHLACRPLAAGSLAALDMVPQLVMEMAAAEDRGDLDLAGLVADANMCVV